MEKGKIKSNYCSYCKHDTRHTVVESASEEGNPDEYHWQAFYQIVQCNGCEKYSFRKEFHDIESYEPGEDSFITVTNFPSVIKGHEGLSHDGHSLLTMSSPATDLLIGEFNHTIETRQSHDGHSL